MNNITISSTHVEHFLAKLKGLTITLSDGRGARRAPLANIIACNAFEQRRLDPAQGFHSFLAMFGWIFSRGDMELYDSKNSVPLAELLC